MSSRAHVEAPRMLPLRALSGVAQNGSRGKGHARFVEISPRLHRPSPSATLGDDGLRLGCERDDIAVHCDIRLLRVGGSRLVPRRQGAHSPVSFASLQVFGANVVDGVLREYLFSTT